MKRAVLLLMLVCGFCWINPTYSLPDPEGSNSNGSGTSADPEKEKNLKDKLVDKVLDELAKAAAKRLHYSRNDVLASGSVSTSSDLAGGVDGDYGDVLVKDSSGTYRHFDGSVATDAEVKAFNKKYPGRSIIPDFTAVKWGTSTTGEPNFSSRLIDSPHGHLDASGLQLSASFDARAGKMTLTDQYGVVHEGLGGKVSAVTSLTLININGETETVTFKKGDFSLQSKLVFAMSANAYVSATSTNMATMNGFYSHNTMDMGLAASARLSMPTDIKYRDVHVTVTPYIGASASTNLGGRYDYDMSWHGGSRSNWGMSSSSGANFEAGVSVSISLDDAAKLTRGIIRSITGR